MPCSSHTSGSIIGCGPCIQVDQNGGWTSHRPQQPFQAPQQGLGISNEPTYTPQESFSLDSLGGPGAGKAWAEGALAGQAFNLPTSMFISLVGSVVGVGLLLLFAFFVLAPAGQRDKEARDAWQGKYYACLELGVDPVTGLLVEGADQIEQSCIDALPPRP